MSGRSMPAPFAIPVTLKVCPSQVTPADATLGRVSVVRIPRAAAAQPSGVSASRAAGIARQIISTGRCSPMTPVENGSTVDSSTPQAAATASAQARASARPRGPVPALALPVLISRYRGAPPQAAKACLASVTGAAQNALRVNTAAQCVPGASSTRTRSSRPALRTPAATVPRRIPSIGSAAPLGSIPVTASVYSEPWHCLYFLPLPQGQGSLRPTLGASRVKVCGAAAGADAGAASASGVASASPAAARAEVAAC